MMNVTRISGTFVETAMSRASCGLSDVPTTALLMLLDGDEDWFEAVELVLDDENELGWDDELDEVVELEELEDELELDDELDETLANFFE